MRFVVFKHGPGDATALEGLLLPRCFVFFHVGISLAPHTTNHAPHAPPRAPFFSWSASLPSRRPRCLSFLPNPHSLSALPPLQSTPTQEQLPKHPHPPSPLLLRSTMGTYLAAMLHLHSSCPPTARIRPSPASTIHRPWPHCHAQITTCQLDQKSTTCYPPHALVKPSLHQLTHHPPPLHPKIHHMPSIPITLLIPPYPIHPNPPPIPNPTPQVAVRPAACPPPS